MMRYCPVCRRTYKSEKRTCPFDLSPTVLMTPGSTEKLLGKELEGRWMIEERLCQGGMGEVYVGRQLSVDRLVAIKLMRDDIIHEPRLMARFFRESKALSALHHPNIVTMFDFGQDEETGILYMVMELLKGSSMSDVLKTGYSFTLSEVLQLMVQLTGALMEAHAHNIIHRDLKPQNLFLESLPGGGFHLKLLDFGIALHDAPEMERLTETGQLQGTPHYMAPEQIERAMVTPQTDLFAAGVILYELLAGVLPFDGETMVEALFNSIHETQPPLEEAWSLSEPLHEGLVGLVTQLLEKDPSNRPASAASVCEQLKGFLRAHEQSLDTTPASVPLLRVSGPQRTPLTLTPDPWPGLTPPAQPAYAVTPVFSSMPSEAEPNSATDPKPDAPALWSEGVVRDGSSSRVRAWVGVALVGVVAFCVLVSSFVVDHRRDEVQVEANTQAMQAAAVKPPAAAAAPTPQPDAAKRLAADVLQQASVLVEKSRARSSGRPELSKRRAAIKTSQTPEGAGDKDLKRLLYDMRKP